ncbi:MAG TPA: TerD family protein [Fimbriimonas sp.]|nr:TerD family protein [Fimbriimonas sp.]
MNHSLYIRRRGKVLPPEPDRPDIQDIAAAATLSKNLQCLGYALSLDLLHACSRLSLSQLEQLQGELVAALSKMLGAHRKFKPMYVDFPRQVMEASDSELYVNALRHYWTSGRLLPSQPKRPRLRLFEPTNLKYLDLGTIEEFEGLFGQIASSNVSWSEQDRLDLAWFVGDYGDGIARLIPATIPQKENLASLSAMLLKGTTLGQEFVRSRVKTATDILRVAVAMSGGDVSLAMPTRFRSLHRADRRFLLELLENRSSVLEDMLRWKERWKRLGESLHPREMASRYPKTARAFDALRNDLAGATFNGSVDMALLNGDVPNAVAKLSVRPGDFARRLDHTLRLDLQHQEQTLDAFRAVAGRVSTPVLLQAWHHFTTRHEPREIRVFFPKGNVAKVHAEPNNLPYLPASVEAAAVLEEALVARFKELPGLGNVYLDPLLRNYPVPFAVRSASKTLRTLPRGSRVPLPPARTLRLFLWWKNGKWRTDIDLSAELLGDGFKHLDTLAYYNLRGYGCVHSGDIVDAPEGACEFIDIDVQQLKRLGVRYVAMVVTSYTMQPYVDLPECFAGWMARLHPGSGEVFEARTVQDRLDLTADTRVALPVLFDLTDNVAIWCDLALRNHPRFVNAVGANLKGIALSVRAIAELNKPSLYSLFRLHALARGEFVDAPTSADTVFSVGAGTPFEQERIASEFLA